MAAAECRVAAVFGAVATVVALRVRASGGVAPGDDMPHVDAAPGEAGEVTVVKGNVVGVGDVVGAASVLLVLSLALGAVFLLARLFSCKRGKG